MIHRLDPRVRVLAAFSCAICLAGLRHWQTAALGLLAAVVLFAVSRPPLRPTLKRLAVVNTFLLFLWLLVPLSAALTSHSQSLTLTVLATLKANAMALVCLTLLCTMDMPVLGQALERLRCPKKLVFLLLFAWRSLGTVAEEWARLFDAARLRGFVSKSGLHSYRTFGMLLGMTFMRGMDRAVRVDEAMRLRCFSGHFGLFADFRARFSDAVFAALILIVLAALIVCDVRVGFVCG